MKKAKCAECETMSRYGVITTDGKFYCRDCVIPVGTFEQTTGFVNGCTGKDLEVEIALMDCHSVGSKIAALKWKLSTNTGAVNKHTALARHQLDLLESVATDDGTT